VVLSYLCEMVIAMNVDTRFNKIYYYYISIPYIDSPPIWKEYNVTVFIPTTQVYWRHYLHPTPKLMYNCLRNQTYNVPHHLVLWLKGTCLFCYIFFFSNYLTDVLFSTFSTFSTSYWIFPIWTNAINKWGTEKGTFPAPAFFSKKLEWWNRVKLQGESCILR